MFTHDYSLKPGKNPRISPPEIPGKSPTFSENFRKFPEIPENPGNHPRKIVHFWGTYKRLQPEIVKKTRNFLPEIREKLQKFWKFPEIPEISEILGRLPNFSWIPLSPISY
jgi:hypothetical protein